jgi:hypothetical protein
MLRVSYLNLVIAGLLIGLASSQEWLDGGYLSNSAGSGMVQYFTEPIFHPNPIGAQPQGYYPYSALKFIYQK